MATIIRTVKNLSSLPILVTTQKISLPPGVNVDLYTVLTDDQLLVAQAELEGLVARGVLQIVKTDSSEELQAGGSEAVTGTFIAYNDNATSLRVKGPNHTSEGGIDVQSYSGIFYNDAYANTGTLKTRVVHGANLEMDMEVQAPHQLRLTAVDDSQSDGQLFLSSKTNCVLNLRADAEVASPKQLVIDRVTTGSTGSSNTSDVNVRVNSGNLYLNLGVTDGAVALAPLTTVQRDAITPVAGMIIFNSSTNKHQGYDGSAWNDLY